MEKILVVDDEKDLCWMLYNLLKDEGYKAILANNGRSAINKTKNALPDLVLLDLKLPDIDGIDVLRRIKDMDDTIPVIMITAYGDVSSAVSAMKLGAIDYITKPFDTNELIPVIKKALQVKSLSINIKTDGERLRATPDNENLIDSSPQIRNILEEVKIVARTEMTVLIQGESGTGKDLVAKLIHSNSNRAHKKFVTMDCGTIPESLIESEMFGYEKGAFTGAEKTKEGIFEAANDGTIFLNEIGNLTESAQKRFLSILENKQLQRLGGKGSISVDVRIVAATNLPLKEAVKNGSFRQDLFFRLNQFPICIPPLRARIEDILSLAGCFLNKANHELKKDIKVISHEAEKQLLLYSWPGNVRELKNVIRMATLKAKAPIIGMEDLSLDFETEDILNTVHGKFAIIKDINQFKNEARKAKDELEKDIIRKALIQAKGNKKMAAGILGITRSALYDKMERLGIKKGIRHGWTGTRISTKI